MADRFFNAKPHEVRAFLREIAKPGTGKSQHRTVLKPQPHHDGRHWRWHSGGWSIGNPLLIPGHSMFLALPFHPGDRLWCRETVRGEELEDGQDGVRYRADDAFIPIAPTLDAAGNWLALHTYRWDECAWVPTICMPRWASRLTLLVTGVKVERLNSISEEDVLAEGTDRFDSEIVSYRGEWAPGGVLTSSQEVRTRVPAYRRLWESIHGAGSWDANPWVAAYTFKPVLANIDSGERDCAKLTA